jgi:FtsH-binding integral membrane protein
MGLRLTLSENLLLSAILINVAGLAEKVVLRRAGIAAACFFLLKSLMASTKIKKFDKTQAKYVNKEFQDADE